jgi:hypothetical protein
MKHAIFKLDIDQLKPYLLYYLVTKYIGKWRVDYIRLNIPGKYTFQKFLIGRLVKEDQIVQLVPEKNKKKIIIFKSYYLLPSNNKFHDCKFKKKSDDLISTHFLLFWYSKIQNNKKGSKCSSQ